MKVFIAPKLNKPNTQKTLEAVIAKLTELGIEPVTGELKSEELSACDAVITIGGDGTILKIGKIAARAERPLLGINTGRLGFMATLESDELDKLERLKNGGYRISRRILLDVVSNSVFDNALNDVVLHRGARSKLPMFIVSRNEVEILRVRADGIIVGTPTGSTAYSLSAGGAIIEPELECIVVTALCPHTLFNRSMIFSGKGWLNISYRDCDGEVFVSVDGGEGEILEENQIVKIAQSADYLDLIDIDGNNFYDSIHNKLMKPLK
ncbi:MAG: NAD(+)/NADH kinase [Oscillospiraceae bacterium]|jgi:NAD+ kinase|nr:NAD(+)/NADH kinase [Oscillospiraceae bacterium]